MNKGSRRSTLAGALALLVLCAGSWPAYGQELAPQSATVLYFAGSEGKITTPPCMTRGYNRVPTWAQKAKTLGEAPLAGPRLVIDNGALFGTNPFCDYLLRSSPAGDSPEEPAETEIQRRLEAYTPDLQVLGADDFFIDEPVARRRQREVLRRSSRKLSAVNVRCSAPESCGFVSSESFVWELGAQKIAFVPLLLEGLVGRVPAVNLKGVTQSAVDEAFLAKELAGLEARGVTSVVLVARVGTAVAKYQDLQEFMEAFPQILFAMSDAGGASALYARDAQQQIRVVNLDGSPTGAARLEISLDGRPELSQVSAYDLAPEPDEVILDPDSPSEPLAGFCREWQRPLIPVLPPASFWEPEAFARYMLQVLRYETSADLVIWNRPAFRTTFLGSLKGERPALTEGLLQGVMPFENEVVVVLVPGAALLPLLKALAFDPKGLETRGALRACGVTLGAKDTLSINGRSFDEARVYRVAMNDFLYEGGDDRVSSAFREAVLTRSSAGATRGVVRRYFQERRYEDFGEGIDVEAFPGPARRPRWTLRGVTNMGFDHSTTTNDAAYSESQLSKGALIQFRGQVEVHADVETLQHRVRNLLSARYKTNGIDASQLKEVEDQVVLENSYSWSGFARLWSDKPSAWLPSPFVKSRLETEFERAPEAAYRHLQWTGSLGWTWSLFDTLSAYLGYAATREVLDDEGAFHYGFSAGYELQPWALFRAGRFAVELSSRFDLTYTELSETPLLRGYGFAALAVPILGPLALSARHDLFLLQRSGQALAASQTSSLGLSLDLRNIFQL